MPRQHVWRRLCGSMHSCVCLCACVPYTVHVCCMCVHRMSVCQHRGHPMYVCLHSGQFSPTYVCARRRRPDRRHRGLYVCPCTRMYLVTSIMSPNLALCVCVCLCVCMPMRTCDDQEAHKTEYVLTRNVSQTCLSASSAVSSQRPTRMGMQTCMRSSRQHT
jgi:hypothetical protein